nr:MAG TPA: hypothetical protein [Caudoviricetes sp.]
MHRRAGSTYFPMESLDYLVHLTYSRTRLIDLSTDL